MSAPQFLKDWLGISDLEYAVDRHGERLQRVEHWRRPVEWFYDADSAPLRVFVGDVDITDQIARKWALYREGMITVRIFDQDRRLRGDSGVLWVRLEGEEEIPRVAYGGAPPVGAGVVGSQGLGEQYPVLAEWAKHPTHLFYGLRFRLLARKDGDHEFVHVEPDSPGAGKSAWHLHGTWVSATIPIY